MSSEDSSFLDSRIESEPMSCKCRGTCQRGKPTRRAGVGCPCKSFGSFCNYHCKCGTKKRPCRNKAPEESSASSEESSSDEGRTEEVQGSVEEAIDESAGSISHEANIQRYVKGLSRERLEDVATELLRRQPEALSDFTPPQTTRENQPTEIPLWCKCTKCSPMPTIIENKCCCRRIGDCITESQAFRDICLNVNVLSVNMQVREDELANEENRSNSNYRHYSYRNYIYWKFGRLGRGNRLVIPACCY
ncbi:hypothetical protein BSL78_24529 [Apostichopus japonicus]|uniref:P2X purinoreceptor 7 intracellular domain-containing protein n=1 Tax=Stichopus japonicus TaxID=307972 RepID=A0A2G8JSC0_STIJA|nr:hypothetical protein BSL78_24529 [Apostichopus japonicus]